jgi:hypothetical protein
VSTRSADPEALKSHEAALQRALLVWILTGLAFMLLPGTFLGVWNLIAITDQQTAARIDPAWIQAHGHAQIFGWVGTFILGIGFYSLSKMGGAGPFAVRRAWISLALWTAGVALRWYTNLWPLQWRWTLPVSALLELAGFLLFFFTVLRHRPAPVPEQLRTPRPVWMRVVISATLGFLVCLLVNLTVSCQLALSGSDPAVPHDLNQRLLALYTWAFPVLTIWGFSARWLPVFLGLEKPAGRLLLAALGVNGLAVISALLGWWVPSTALFLTASVLAAAALHVFVPAAKPAKTKGVHSSFPLFVRLAYGWLIVSAVLSLLAALWDQAGGLWGASRHALTVGYVSTMIFAVGQRVLPAFCGMRLLFSPNLMFASLALLNSGCLLRVASETGAYEGYAPALWPLLPVSALIEMTAVTVFAVNLVLTFRQPPPHLATLGYPRSSGGASVSPSM